MKINYKNILKKSKLFFLLFFPYLLVGQVKNDGNVYIDDLGEIYVNNANYDFGTQSASTATSRSAVNYGVLSFSESSTWSNVSDSHHIDGFARSYGANPFMAPIGNSGVYAPIKIYPDTATINDAAYFRESPSTIGSTLNSSINGISSNEYWKIKGNGLSKISLSWRPSSGLSSLLLTPSLTYITILGFDGAEWVEIPSFFDESSIYGGTSDVNMGSISSINSVDLNSFEAYTIGVKSQSSCYPILVSSGVTKTWNGSAWSPSAPTINDPVSINAPFSGSLSCYSVTLNSDITLNNNDLLDVVDGFSGTGKIIMSSEASLLQRSSSGNPPKIEITKVTSPMRRFDYVFLSNPINDFSTFLGDLNSNASTAVNGQFGSYPSSAFYYYFTDNDAGNSVVVTNNNVSIGRGFAATVTSNQAPYSISSATGSWFSEKYPIHIKTEGITNNGDINLPLPSGAGWVRVGNPYPSPLNANKLLDALGDDVRKTVYYWTFNTPRQNWLNNASNYNNADYATFNYSGGVAACLGCQEPNGLIATMQSVYVKKLNPNPVSFNLTNCMRDLSGNDLFFRTANAASVDKFRINLAGTSNSFSQILISYDAVNGTAGYDNGYDSLRMTGAISSELNTLISGQSSSYAIQTKGIFDINDTVPLQIVKRVEESFTISLANKQGIFDTNEIDIYLHDKVLNVYHNLSQGNYTFLQETTTDNNRFEILYLNNALGIDDIKVNDAITYINDQVFFAQSNINIKEISIFDISGRLINRFEDINNTMFSNPFNHPQAIYIAKFTLENGLILNKKIINQ